MAEDKNSQYVYSINSSGIKKYKVLKRLDSGFVKVIGESGGAKRMLPHRLKNREVVLGVAYTACSIEEALEVSDKIQSRMKEDLAAAGKAANNLRTMGYSYPVASLV